MGRCNRINMNYTYIEREYPDEKQLFENIEDILYCVKTARVHPVSAIHIIKDNIIRYEKRKNNTEEYKNWKLSRGLF